MKFRRTKDLLYKCYRLTLKLYKIPPHLPIGYKGQAANDIIKSTLNTNKPCMICRFGENELRTTVTYLNSTFNIRPNIRGILRRESFDLEDERVKSWMYNCAGFFPSNKSTLSKFAELVIEDIKHIDILGCWLPNETRIKDHLNGKIKTIPLGALDPWNYDTPWTLTLKNKKVLVIHPFEDTIKKQYKKRKLLFENKKVLPEFELIILKAVQSAAGIETSFNTWFDALDYMCSQINKIDFDIAIIGAGAYGFSLAAHIKRIGKKAVHLGGITQLLFGIKGNRWDHGEIEKQLYNEHWIRPLESETPEEIKKVEGGTYW